MSENAYLDLMKGEEERRTAAQAATLNTAVDTNPDRYATQRRVAQYLDYPVAAVEATPDESQREAAVKQVQADTAQHPVLQQKYTDADFAKLAHDDSGTLAAIGDTIVKSAKYITGGPGTSNGFATDLVGSGFYGGARGFAGVFRAAADIGALGVEGLYPGLKVNEDNFIAGGNPLRRLSETFARIGVDSNQRLHALSPPTDGIVWGGISSGVQSLGQNLVMLPIALAAVGAHAEQIGGSSYDEARARAKATQ